MSSYPAHHRKHYAPTHNIKRPTTLLIPPYPPPPKTTRGRRQKTPPPASEIKARVGRQPPHRRHNFPHPRRHPPPSGGNVVPGDRKLECSLPTIPHPPSRPSSRGGSGPFDAPPRAAPELALSASVRAVDGGGSGLCSPLSLPRRREGRRERSLSATESHGGGPVGRGETPSANSLALTFPSARASSSPSLGPSTSGCSRRTGSGGECRRCCRRRGAALLFLLLLPRLAMMCYAPLRIPPADTGSKRLARL